MRFHRLSKILLALLFMATLPLRGYAVPCELRATQTDPAPAADAAPLAHDAQPVHPAHPAHAAHAAHGSLGCHGAACDCCCMAVAAASSSWALAHDSPSAVIARLLDHSPVLTLDRLDRPPRLSA